MDGFKRRVAILAASSGTTLVAATIGMVATAPAASAHGSVQDPPSRVYQCRFLTPDNDMCKQAWGANSQALYDWNEVNQGAAGGNHQPLLPDGQLCSGGRDKYAAFNTASNKWPVTNLKPDADGKYTLKWYATAPHETSYYKVYITKEGFDVNAAPLKWSDLELVGQTGPSARETYPTMKMPLPKRNSHSIMFSIWQRSDSTEAFYACNDVTVNKDGSPDPTPTSASPSPTSASPSPTSASPSPTSASPTATMPAGSGVSLKITKTEEWGSGRNVDVTVTNASGVDAQNWAVTLPWANSVSAWNAVSSDAGGGNKKFVNTSWNGNLGNSKSVTFGFTDTGSVMPNPSTCGAVINGAAVACSIQGATPNPTPTTASPTPTSASPTPTSASPTPTATSSSPTPTPTVTVTPTPTGSAGSATATTVITTNWGTGYCADVKVTTTSPTPIKWQVQVTATKGTVSSVWEADYSLSANKKTITATGKPWNNSVKAGETKIFGFCTG